MAKQTKGRRVGETSAMAKLVNLRTSPRKLGLVAQSIRGLPVQRALNELEFSHNLVVAEAYVGKNFIMKRFSARARGRSARIEKPFSEITVVVRELAGEAA